MTADQRGRFRSQIHLAPQLAPTSLSPRQVTECYRYPDATGFTKTIAVISLGGGVSNTDLLNAGVDPSRVTYVSIDGALNEYTGNPGSADLENALDLQVIGQTFAGNIKLFMAPDSTQGFIDVIAAAMGDPSVDVVSCSWGAPETEWPLAAENAIRAALDGHKPFFASSGDFGPDDGTGMPVAIFPGCAEGATACGGTTLIASGSTILSETDWNSSMVGGGEEGFGFSKVISAPAWQGSAGFRRIPDWVLNADPATGYPILLNGVLIQVGGTSAAAPMAAAGYARLAESLGDAQMPAGSFNVTLYGAPSSAFNTVTLVPGDPAYCVGLGSPNLTALASALITPPVTDLYASPLKQIRDQNIVVRTRSLLEAGHEPVPVEILRDLLREEWLLSTVAPAPSVEVIDDVAEGALEYGDWITIAVDGTAREQQEGYRYEYTDTEQALQYDYYSVESRQRIYDLMAETRRITYKWFAALIPYDKMEWDGFTLDHEKGPWKFHGTARITLRQWSLPVLGRYHAGQEYPALVPGVVPMKVLP